MSKHNLNSIFGQLAANLKGKIILLGIGNSLREDDGFGSLLAQSLKGWVSFKAWDAATSPENFLGAILKENPDTVMLVDAVDFKRKDGEFRLFTGEEVKTGNFFLSHNASPSLLFDFLKESSSAKLFLLALQPKSIGFGEGLSPEVANSFIELKDWFLKNFSSKGLR